MHFCGRCKGLSDEGMTVELMTLSLPVIATDVVAIFTEWLTRPLSPVTCFHAGLGYAFLHVFSFNFQFSRRPLKAI